MLLKVNELQEGDVILVTSQSRLYIAKVLKTPQLRKDNATRYKSVKVSVNAEVQSYTPIYSGKQYTYKTTTLLCTKENHNTVLYKDLQYRDMWLLERDNQPVIYF